MGIFFLIIVGVVIFLIVRLKANKKRVANEATKSEKNEEKFKEILLNEFIEVAKIAEEHFNYIYYDELQKESEKSNED